jgi:heat induced stress protein YflT
MRGLAGSPRTGHTGGMSLSSGATPASPLKLAFPQSLAIYDDYAAAQKAVDHLADHKFPVEQCMIVGTDLKRIERITGRLTTGRVAMGGVLSGLWLGLFVGLVLSFFSDGGALAIFVSTMLIGALFGVIWALLGYALTRDQRDFQSVTQVVATRYEVLVEHKVAAQARELLAKLPGALPNPFE